MASKELVFPDEIFDISGLEERQNVLVYGPPGVGKSVLGGGAGLIMAVEPSGPVSAKRLGSQAKIWPCPQWTDFERGVEWLEDVYAAGHRPFEWITVDTANAMQHSMMRWILEEEKRKNPNRDIDRPEIQDHFKWQQMFRRFVLRLNDLPANILYLSNELRYEDSDGDTLTIPAFAGKAREGYEISSWVCSQMDSVGRMTVEDIKVKPKGWQKGEPLKDGKRRQIRFEPEKHVFAKDRSGNLSPFVARPTLADLHTKMLEPPGVVSPMPLAGVAQRTDGPRQVSSDRLAAIPAAPAPASPDAVEDAEIIDVEDNEEK